ncbi:DUF317 domain-containing protein [Streptomyces diacarni]|uniref:DUF317 domain-containing protein n=1 Tax=Streptomyces diacarni TaxID=2800381 RepID=UPI0033E30479
MNERQLAAFAQAHGGSIPFDVSPRYLAGPGDARHVTHALAAAGWKPRPDADPLSPGVVLTSPDPHTRLQLDPLTADCCWRLEGQTPDHPHWYALSSERIPEELIAGLTDALVTGPMREQPAVWDVLSTADWRSTQHTPLVRRAASPDGLVEVTRRTFEEDQTPYWHIAVRERSGPSRLVWNLHLSGNTPAHLLTGLATALTNPEPVQREMANGSHYNATSKRSSLTPQQVINAHKARLEKIRAQARTARRQRPSAQPAPVPAARPTPGARSR